MLFKMQLIGYSVAINMGSAAFLLPEMGPHRLNATTFNHQHFHDHSPLQKVGSVELSFARPFLRRFPCI